MRGRSARSAGVTIGILFALGLTGVAFAAPGDLDPTFGDHGVVRTATAPDSGSDNTDGLAIQPDGRIVVAGSSGPIAGDRLWRVSRYTIDGTLDPSFGSGGTVLTDISTGTGGFNHVYSLALQDDGKIVATGPAFTPGGGYDFGVARYLPDGRLDQSFGHGGKVITAIGPGTHHDEARGVAVDGAGRIVVAGNATINRVGTKGFDLALVRYLPSGALDPSFNAGGDRPGIVTTDVAGYRDQLNDLMIDASGRLVGVGTANFGGRGKTIFAVARYLTSGRLDPSFNPAGPLPGVATAKFAPPDSSDIAFAGAIDASGRILAAGSADSGDFTYDVALARFDPNGSLDGSFGTGGKVLTNVGPGNTDDDVQGVAIQRDGRILIGGSAAKTVFQVDGDSMVARYKPNGSLDPSFGNGGISVTPLAPGGRDDEIWAIALQTDSRLIAAAECVRPESGRDVCVARYKAGLSD